MAAAARRQRPASLAARRQRGLGGGGDTATAEVIAWRRRWQRVNRLAASGSTAVATVGSMSAARHWRTSDTTAVLPPHASAVEMKTAAATAMAGAQTINNQLNAVTVMVTETATMTATALTMETKGTVAAAEAQQLHRGGGQLDSSGSSLAIARHWRRRWHRQWQVAAVTFVSIVIVIVIVAVSVAVAVVTIN